MVKAGWLRKDRGRWYVTGVGRKALSDHSSPRSFLAAKDAGYRYWDRNRDRFAWAEQLIEAIPDGQWASAAEDGAGEPAEPRAWLVRGSAAPGTNLVEIWLDQGYCSLSAARLRELPPGASRDRIRAAVEEDYQHASYSERNKKTAEFHAFLSRMNDGDLVVTTDGPRAYLGEIVGPPTFTSSAGNVANLQRPVRWRRDTADPLDFADLPDEMAARLSSQHDVLDLTEFADDLRKLLGEEQAVTVRAAELPDVTDELARRLLMDRDWLQECVELLRDQRQVILYGPPGTGKTYLALELAAHLTGEDPQRPEPGRTSCDRAVSPLRCTRCGWGR